MVLWVGVWYFCSNIIHRANVCLERAPFAILTFENWIMLQQQLFAATSAASSAARSAAPPAYSRLGAAELQALLAKREASNAMKTRELDEMELAVACGPRGGIRAASRAREWP